MHFTSLITAFSLLGSFVSSAPAPAAAPSPNSLTTTTAATTPSDLLVSRDTTDTIVYIGDVWTDTLEMTLNAILDTETNILYMAEQIGFMADRIVYVTEISQSGALEVSYLVVGVLYLGIQEGSYLYQLALLPVAALPADWL